MPVCTARLGDVVSVMDKHMWLHADMLLYTHQDRVSIVN
jgi:hypothetical protein